MFDVKFRQWFLSLITDAIEIMGEGSLDGLDTTFRVPKRGDEKIEYEIDVSIQVKEVVKE